MTRHCSHSSMFQEHSKLEARGCLGRAREISAEGESVCAATPPLAVPDEAATWILMSGHVLQKVDIYYYAIYYGYGGLRGGEHRQQIPRRSFRPVSRQKMQKINMEAQILRG